MVILGLRTYYLLQAALPCDLLHAAVCDEAAVVQRVAAAQWLQSWMGSALKPRFQSCMRRNQKMRVALSYYYYACAAKPDQARTGTVYGATQVNV